MANDRVLGIDIGSSAIKIAQVDVSGDRPVVEAFTSVALPPETVVDGAIGPGKQSVVANALRAVMDTPGLFSTKNAIVGLNASSSVFFQKKESVPRMDEDTMRKSIVNIVEASKAGFNMDEICVDYAVIGEETRGSKLRLMLFLVHDKYVESMCKAVEAAGLNVVGADISALATLRGTEIDLRGDTTSAIVGIGAESTTVLMHSGGVPLALFLEPTGAGNEASRAIADVTDGDAESDAVEEYKTSNTRFDEDVADAINEYSHVVATKLKATFLAFSRNNPEAPPVTSVTLVGGGSFLQGLARVIQNELNLMVQYGKPDPQFEGDLSHAVLHLTAMGLATGATR